MPVVDLKEINKKRCQEAGENYDLILKIASVHGCDVEDRAACVGCFREALEIVEIIRADGPMKWLAQAVVSACKYLCLDDDEHKIRFELEGALKAAGFGALFEDDGMTEDPDLEEESETV